jgi:hypothetical protein
VSQTAIALGLTMLFSSLMRAECVSIDDAKNHVGETRCVTGKSSELSKVTEVCTTSTSAKITACALLLSSFFRETLRAWATFVNCKVGSSKSMGR